MTQKDHKKQIQRVIEPNNGKESSARLTQKQYVGKTR